ncbi:OB-fold nucleic acid binding domain protein, partial [Vibrio parahaemolyticus EKP-028]
VPRSD